VSQTSMRGDKDTQRALCT